MSDIVAIVDSAIFNQHEDFNISNCLIKTNKFENEYDFEHLVYSF